MAIQHAPMAPAQRTGTAAAVSGIVALVGYIATLTGHPGWGILAFVVAILLGVAGLVIATSPRVGGGWIALAAIIFGVIGLILAIIVAIGVIVF